MSFGPDRFECDAEAASIFGRYLLFYLLPIMFFVLGLAAAVLAGTSFGPLILYSKQPLVGAAMVLVIALSVYALTGLIALAFYSAYLREAIGKLRWNDLRFSFEARTGECVVLLVTNTLLVIGTLGLGYLFLSYRNWKFFIRHLEAEGIVQLDELSQSREASFTDAEGLASAFDIGAI